MKIIDNILDDYLFKRLFEGLVNDLDVRYGGTLDIKYTVVAHHRYKLFVKKRKYNDDQWAEICNYSRSFAVSVLAEYDQVAKTLKEIVDHYLENERWK